MKDEIFNGGLVLERYKNQVERQISVNLNRNKNGDITSYDYPKLAGMNVARKEKTRKNNRRTIWISGNHSGDFSFEFKNIEKEIPFLDCKSSLNKI